jgi:hypothetical protein
MTVIYTIAGTWVIYGELLYMEFSSAQDAEDWLERYYPGEVVEWNVQSHTL